MKQSTAIAVYVTACVVLAPLATWLICKGAELAKYAIDNHPFVVVLFLIIALMCIFAFCSRINARLEEEEREALRKAA